MPRSTNVCFSRAEQKRHSATTSEKLSTLCAVVTIPSLAERSRAGTTFVIRIFFLKNDPSQMNPITLHEAWEAGRTVAHSSWTAVRRLARHSAGLRRPRAGGVPAIVSSQLVRDLGAAGT